MAVESRQPYDIVRAALAEPSPCDGCRHASECSQLAWACDAFVLFANGGSAQRWVVAPRQPSRALFVALL
jgi:hypothetical protein